MPHRVMPQKTVVTINSLGRQSASFIRVASAIGWEVKGHIHTDDGIVAQELKQLPGVNLTKGRLEDKQYVADLFQGAQLAFINTTHWGDEVAIGRALADAAKKAGIQHYIYSSMPDHSIFGEGWRGLPMWSAKFTVENYVRQIGLPATFVYCGIYHNNFTGLNFPLFQMANQPDGSFVWQAPFHPDHKLPWLDSEHDIGPAVLSIFKQGPRKLNGTRIPLAYEHLSPREACRHFAKGVGRHVRYIRASIEIDVQIPIGYREHLEALEETLGEQGAPYFGPELEPDCTRMALELWEGNRPLEVYAREIFPTEEAANGLTWMEEGDEPRTPISEVNVDVYQGSM